jgi:hypothetical protein
MQLFSKLNLLINNINEKKTTFKKVVFFSFILFMPFHYALTYKIGFNIKVSEICMLILIAFNFKELVLKLKNLNTVEKLFGLFIVWTTISFIFNQIFYKNDFSL